MRIVSGIYINKVIFSQIYSAINPMSEQMRGAIFASLGDLSGLNSLNLFSGTGSLGLDALSQYAKQVTLLIVAVNKLILLK